MVRVVRADGAGRGSGDDAAVVRELFGVYLGYEPGSGAGAQVPQALFRREVTAFTEDVGEHREAFGGGLRQDGGKDMVQVFPGAAEFGRHGVRGKEGREHFQPGGAGGGLYGPERFKFRDPAQTVAGLDLYGPGAAFEEAFRTDGELGGHVGRGLAAEGFYAGDYPPSAGLDVGVGGALGP